ncbi:hypothetical protein HMPREF1986_00161 [Oribacterium sp. oral taxon 078 str. F0263]|nr:hypothetical protein HMPREF1986_00161 [Oribacterium sp. oral taxon 078 str. F0263]
MMDTTPLSPSFCPLLHTPFLIAKGFYGLLSNSGTLASAGFFMENFSFLSNS